ncbi:hypothetical protein [Ruminococcus albus]|uniref:DUF4179 domain-containing protein n=1 Tax=Ruminococcus albus TaxID=1264 RepID=A0A1I1FAK6_RUMAL|nr:hypothetical protein [Ruminococcus albus]SFB94183.1 hypothetical protein SAMN02910406_00866 [Ruminococcus albus]
MKAETFMNAMGMIDDRYIETDMPKKKTSIKWKKTLISVAAAAIVLCPLPALTAFGVAPAYYMLYKFSPAVAQNFKPVERSCEDKGIEMTVISAQRSGSTASVYLAMRDTEGKYPQGEWDLFDSYNINVPSDSMSGTCSFAEYDSDTHTAYFLVELDTVGRDMPKGKVTFSVSEMLLGKERTEGIVNEIDMDNIPCDPRTCTLEDVEIRGMSLDEIDCQRFLTIPEKPICTPANGVSIQNIGYFDGALHILEKYDDIFHTDNHSFLSILDNNGKDIVDESLWESIDYWGEQHIDAYREHIIRIPYEKLSGSHLYGEFVTSDNYISGDWEITFTLE